MRPSSSDKCQRGRDPVVREDGSIEIPLTQGQVAVVDADDYRFVRNHLWQAHITHSGVYAASRPYSKRASQVLMHRVITAARGGDVDHINHDPIDNRRSNLRVVTHQQNLCNAVKHARGWSVFKGVTWNARRNKWYASIQSNGERRHLGVFVNERDAAMAYDRAAREMNGEFAHTNEDGAAENREEAAS